MENKKHGINLITSMNLTPEALIQLEQYCQRAEQTGPSVLKYMLLLIRHGRMEKRIVDGCKAILRLQKGYGSDRLELACYRALSGNRYNFKTIQSILDNHLESKDLVSTSEQSVQTGQTHNNLRGASSFNVKNN